MKKTGISNRNDKARSESLFLIYPQKEGKEFGAKTERKQNSPIENFYQAMLYFV